MSYLIAIILALTPFYIIRFNIAGIPTTLLELSIYAVFLIGLARNYSQLPLLPKQKKDLIKNPFFLFLLLFFLSAIISTFISPDLKNSLGAFKAWFIDGMLVFLLITFFTKTQKDFSVMLGGLSVGALAVAAVGIWQYFAGDVLPDGRITSLYIYDNVLIPSGGLSNFVALYLAPIVLLQMGYLAWQVDAGADAGAGLYPAPHSSAENKRSRVQPCSCAGILKFLLGFSIAAELFALYLTRSYGGMLGLAAGLLAILAWKFLYGKGSWNKKALATALVGLAALALIFSQANTGKFQNLFDATGPTSTSARFQIWQASWLMARDNPVPGVGLNNFETAYREYIPKVAFPPLEWLVPHAHNLYLSLWLETGILGLVSFLLLIGFASCQLIQKRTIFSITIFASLASILIHGLVDTPILKNDLAIVFWMILGFVGYAIPDNR